MDSLVAACRTNKPSAQKVFFDMFSGGMLMLCIRYVKNKSDAEEIMLNGFLNFFTTIERFNYNGEKSIYPWLRKIMVNECLMYIRKQKEYLIVEESYAEDIELDNSIWNKMNTDAIMKKIMELPDGYRTIFNLYAIEGYTHKEISTLLQINEGTSKSQLHKAKLMLQKML